MDGKCYYLITRGDYFNGFDNNGFEYIKNLNIICGIVENIFMLVIFE